MKVQFIGHNQYRIKVRDKRRRKRLTLIAGIQVFEDGRVIFSIENLGAVMNIVIPNKKGRVKL
mgnify:CR=1 FL=1